MDEARPQRKCMMITVTAEYDDGTTEEMSVSEPAGASFAHLEAEDPVVFQLRIAHGISASFRPRGFLYQGGAIGSERDRPGRG
jgi:hypothetical protein